MIRYQTFGDWNAETKRFDRKTVEVGDGTTLFVKTETERVMSDMWDWITRAYYWTPEGLCSVAVSNGDEYTERTVVEIDADYDAIITEFKRAARARALDRATAEAQTFANNGAVKGREVVVTRGRSNVGVCGKVVVVKEMPYRAGYRTQILPKLAIALDDEMTTWIAPNGRKYPAHKNVVWVWARNVEVANPTYDADQVARTADAVAARETAEFRANCVRYGALAA